MSRWKCQQTRSVRERAQSDHTWEAFSNRTADGEPGSGSFFGAVAAGDLDLGFRGPEVSFGLVVGVRDGQVVSEEQDLAVVVAEPFQ